MNKADAAREYLSTLALFEDEIYLPAKADVSKPAQPVSELRVLDGSLQPLPASLAELEQQIKDCTRCALGHTRTKFVFGDGDAKARIVFVGEAPGHDEDQTGVPFVGRAGQLLNQMLSEADFDRKDVYICNTLKCRPPGNRDPEPEEKATCRPYLRAQLSLISPEIIVCLGKHAANELLGTDLPMKELRGRVIPWEGMQLLVTYHPAYYLRNMSQKVHGDADFKLLRELFDKLN
ncbi:MAG: uracil-DNA glycosylase [Calditrichaeota bacterium]|nr:uracil-DNA glycosylase [Calditrichota bacterium]MCB9391550.1 uracil-DNA glycosylase [Calditrichota bacterium]